MSEGIRVESTLENLRAGNFDPEAEPVTEVPQGAVVEIETVSPYSVDVLTDSGVPRDRILEDELAAVRKGTPEGPGPHVVTGPIAIEGAEPGDVLEVQVRDVELRTTYGVNSFDPGGGVLSEGFSELDVDVVRLDRERETASLDSGIEIPIDPFFGIMAVAPSVDRGRVSTAPPGCFGGNIDVKALGAGSTVYFPVRAGGGLFFVGDGHAAQGNGEVNSTAIETSLTGTFVFRVHEDTTRLAYPIAETEAHYVVIGIDETLDAALEHAVRETVSFLVQQTELSAADAYRVSSVAVDFNVSQAVNGNKGVHGLVPKSIFEDHGGIDPGRSTEPDRWDCSNGGR